MKLFTSTILTSMFLFAAPAFAILPGPDISTAAVNSQDVAELGHIASGDITVNATAKTIEMNLSLRFVCPAGRFCTQSIPAPIHVEVPLVAVSAGACGEKLYVGRNDRRPVDGMLTEVQVLDYSNSRCRPTAPTVIVYRLVSPRGDAEQVSTITALPLARRIY